MTQKNLAYDHPAYLARLSHSYAVNVAGASTAFAKFVSFGNLRVLAITASAFVASTSTQTQWNGTGTVVNINGDQFYGIHVINIGALTDLGTATAVTTTTHGPFSLSTGTSTTTSVAGAVTRVQLYGTGTSGNVQSGRHTADGGVAMGAGDTFHILRGTDATAVSGFAIEYAVDPVLGSVTV
jgi:hypothetical protein